MLCGKFNVSCQDLEFIKTNRYQTRTVNIKPRSFLRYPFVTSGIVYFKYLGVIPRSETALFRVISITDLQFSPFSDMSLEHKIFSHGRIFALIAVSTTSQ